MPIDFASITSDGAVVMGVVVAGVVGVYVVIALVRMGIRWISAALSGDGINYPVGITRDDVEEFDGGDSEDEFFAHLKDGRSFYVSSDGKWTRIKDL
jgi:hypothetical protein